MSRSLWAVIFVDQESKPKRAGLNPCFQPLLGQLPLQMTVKLAEKVQPEQRIILTAEGNYLGRELENLGWKIVAAEKLDLGTALKIVSAVGSSREKPDILFLNPRFPLLRVRSLFRLLQAHRLQQAGLSYFSLERGRPGGEKKKGRQAAEVVNSFPAFVVNKGELAGHDKERISPFTNLSKAEDLIDWIKDKGGKTITVWINREEGLDLYQPKDKAAIVAYWRQEKIRGLAARGVVFLDPASVWIDLKVKIGAGSVISPGVVIEGESRLGEGVTVHPFVHIIDSQIGRRAKILSATVIEGCRLEAEVQVGPFAHLRPGTILKAGARVGNFVEMKKTVFGRGSKAMHLSYLGDSQVGNNVNIGAGTITCNYDGRQKHRTIIEAGAFIGSGTELVAPVKIGRGAYVGAGSTITRNVSPDSLAVARARQVEIPGWAKKRRSQ